MLFDLKVFRKPIFLVNMVNIELKPIYHFGASSNRAQYIFDDLLRSALFYKMNGKGEIKIRPT